MGNNNEGWPSIFANVAIELCFIKHRMNALNKNDAFVFAHTHTLNCD